MTNSRTSSRGSRNGSKAIEVKAPAKDDSAGARTTVSTPSWLHLSRGMSIRAVVEARLLGRRLLTLDADVVILPARAPRTQTFEGHGYLAQRSPADRNGSGGGLIEAARALESGAADLRAARQEIP